jgi:hypothetical protein
VLQRCHIACAPRGASWAGPAGYTLAQIRYVFVPTGTVAGWRKEHPVENIPLTIFFVELGKRETHSHNVHLPFIEIGGTRLPFMEIGDAPQ